LIADNVTIGKKKKRPAEEEMEGVRKIESK